MEFDKALWPSSLSGLIIRVPIGLYFFLSGRLLLNDFTGLVNAIKSFGIIPEAMVYPYSIILTYGQIMLGILLVLGFWTSLIAIVSALLLMTFIGAFGIYPNETLPFNKDIVWLAACLALLSTGPGAFSIDNFRNKKS